MKWSNRKRNNRTYMAAAFAVCALLSGCGGSNHEDRVKAYGQDGYMGYTNTNPNLPGRNMATTYESDGDMVGQVLAPLKGIKSKRVVINGAAMHVTITVDPTLTDAEVTKLRRNAQAVVQYNMPRYIVHVEAVRS